MLVRVSASVSANASEMMGKLIVEEHVDRERTVNHLMGSLPATCHH